jgi:hypothetical protein
VMDDPVLRLREMPESDFTATTTLPIGDAVAVTPNDLERESPSALRTHRVERFQLHAETRPDYFEFL